LVTACSALSRMTLTRRPTRGSTSATRASARPPRRGTQSKPPFRSRIPLPRRRSPFRKTSYRGSSFRGRGRGGRAR
jgi:hypothetical protein